MPNRDKDFLKSIAPLGAKASAEFQRNRAIVKYQEKNPHCRYCKTPILLNLDRTYRRTIASMSRRQFCDSACSAKHRWAVWREKYGKQGPRKFKPWINTTPFKKLENSYVAEVSRHARNVYFSRYPEGKCEHCGLVDRELIEVAHIKAVQLFSKDTQIFVVNQIENLKGLCANCHKKFDRNLPGKKGHKRKTGNTYL